MSILEKKKKKKVKVKCDWSHVVVTNIVRHGSWHQYLHFQTLKMLPHLLYLAKFGVIDSKLITSVTVEEDQSTQMQHS